MNPNTALTTQRSMHWLIRVILLLITGGLLGTGYSQTNLPPILARNVNITGSFYRDYRGESGSELLSLGCNLKVAAGNVTYGIHRGTRYIPWLGTMRRGPAMGFADISVTRLCKTRTSTLSSNYWLSGKLVLGFDGNRYAENLNLFGVPIDGYFSRSGLDPEFVGFFFEKHGKAFQSSEFDSLAFDLANSLGSSFPSLIWSNSFSKSEFLAFSNVFSANISNGNVITNALTHTPDAFHGLINQSLGQGLASALPPTGRIKDLYPSNEPFRKAVIRKFSDGIYQFIRNDHLLVDAVPSSGSLSSTNQLSYLGRGLLYGNTVISVLNSNATLITDTTRNIRSPRMDWAFAFGVYKVSGRISVPASDTFYVGTSQTVVKSKGATVNLILSKLDGSRVSLSPDAALPSADDKQLNKFLSFLLVTAYDFFPPSDG